MNGSPLLANNCGDVTMATIHMIKLGQLTDTGIDGTSRGSKVDASDTPFGRISFVFMQFSAITFAK